MKLLKFNLDEAPEDATDFYYQIVEQAVSAGFEVPDYMVKRNLDLTVTREELFEAIIVTFAEIAHRGGPNYTLSKYGSRITMTDEPSKLTP